MGKHSIQERNHPCHQLHRDIAYHTIQSSSIKVHPLAKVMDTSSTKSSQKLLHKFAPFRKRQLKQARSNNALAEDLPSVDEIAISLQSPGSVSTENNLDVITSDIVEAGK